MKKTLLSLGLAVVASNASAGLITYESRATDAGIDNTDYLASWNNQTSAVNSQELSIFDGVTAAGNNRHSHLNVSFSISSLYADMDWMFEFAPDAGFGGELYFDGVLADRNATNLWWGFDWNKDSELLTAVLNDVGAGSHDIDLFWAEDCCNGSQAGRFSVDNGITWQVLTSANLAAYSVPEPGSIALLGLGLAGLAVRRRKQKS